ncbi:MAG: NAD(P)/FAD-dependent oxidoreductase [Akkermansiaceae bacterium]
MDQLKTDWDLIVIGGGAAGFFGAIQCAEHAPGSRILILEKTGHLLGKVKISGGGRCNVTHACFEPKPLTAHYPRGHKSLIGPFHRWCSGDTVQWFEERGVELKTESDGRMFPVTNSSQTIIDALMSAAEESGIAIQVSISVTSVEKRDGIFLLETKNDNSLKAKNILLATGGTRLAAGAKLATSLDHKLIPNVPSLFAFNIDDPRLAHLPGVSVSSARVSVNGEKLTADGPMLITHHGLSGPGILKLSAWGARLLHEKDYRFNITIDWTPGEDLAALIQETRAVWSKRLVRGRSPLAQFPKRLWDSLCRHAEIDEACTWSHLSKDAAKRLETELRAGQYEVSGKSINKDEFVTCGGVHLPEVNLKTMESKLTPGLYFAGEVLDIDGITGGFNFQNAWTTGHLAGIAIAENCG